MTHPVAELGSGETLREMTCMNYYPRSATVRAKPTARCRNAANVLDVLQKSKIFRAQLDRPIAGARSIHLRDVAIFFAPYAGYLSTKLRERVELLRSPGQVIANRCPANSFYLVRLVL